MEGVCSSCDLKHYQVIVDTYNNNDAALEIFRNHGVIPRTRNCPKCGKPCFYRKDRHTFLCTKKFKDPIGKRFKNCNFEVSELSGTWLSQSRIPAGRNLIFCSLFLRKTFNQAEVENQIGLCSEAAVNWKSYCSEVCQNWLNNQKPIGGPGIIVEIDESKFGRSKYNRGREVTGVWLVGGIERGSKRKFVIPVRDRTADTLIPLIQQHVLPGTTIYTDCWKSYSKLCEVGYTHQVVNHSENFVDPCTGVHTQNIERLWKDIKSWVLRSGNRKEHYEQYLARYLFQAFHPDSDSRLHHFLLQIKELYPPPQP